MQKESATNLKSSLAFAQREPSQPIMSPPRPDDIDRFVRAIANNTWRLCKRLEHDSETKSLSRPVEGLLNALAELGVHIKEHTGEPYDTGMAVNVIAWERQPEIGKEVIIETIKPSIRWNEKLLQWGDVIVCSPSGETNIEAMEGVPL